VKVIVDMVIMVGLKMNGDDYGHGACGGWWWWVDGVSDGIGCDADA
jgi:hypothetical protein